MGKFKSLLGAAALVALGSGAHAAGSFSPHIGLVAAVPEPGTWALMLLGLGGIGGLMRQRSATVRKASKLAVSA